MRVGDEGDGVSIDKFEDRRFWCLEGLDLFNELSPEDRKELRPFIQDVAYNQGESIYLPGDPSTTLYFLKKGNVKLAYLDESGRHLTLLILKPGQPFGILALTGEETHNEIAEALTDVVLCMLRREDFLTFLRTHPQYCLNVTKLIGQRMQQIEQKLEDLIFKNLSARLAALLLRLFREFGEPCTCSQSNSWKRIALKLTHQELAELVGATRESSSAELKRLEKLGLISYCKLGLTRGCKRSIVILNEEKLKAIASS